MQFVDFNESRDRRLQMLLQTANQLQQNQVAREENQIRRDQLLMQNKDVALRDPAQNKFLRAEMATQNRSRLADARYKLTTDKEWKPRSMQEALSFEQSKLGFKKANPSPSEQKAMMDIEDRELAKESAKNNVFDSAQSTLDTISQIKSGAKYFGARSFEPGAFGLNPDKVKWDANFDKLKANLIINLMTSMKNASKTGATGFGQLNRDELKVLQDGATALKKTLSWKDAKPILDDMEIKLNKVVGGGGDAVDSFAKDAGIPPELAEKLRGLEGIKAIREKK